MSTPPRAPSGGAPPEVVVLPDGGSLELVPIAREVARRHRLEFPDEAERYGDRGIDWCVHDNQWLLSWAVTAAAGYGDFGSRLNWLAGVLGSRGYPVERLARDLELAAERIEAEPGLALEAVRSVLLAGAATVRDRVG